MKLNTWNKPTQFLNDVEFELEQSSILEAHRYIYLFFAPEDILNHQNNTTIPHNQIYGKAIQINLAIAGSDEEIGVVPWMRCENGTTMYACMYTYDVIFDTDISNFVSAKFTLLNGMAVSSTNDYSLHKTMSNGSALYSKDLRDKPDMKNLLSVRTLEYAPSVPPPQYYTPTHQNLSENEVYCITSLETAIQFEGQELLDDYTRISVMNVLDIDTMENKMRDKLYQIRAARNNPLSGVTTYDSTALSDQLLFQEFESMQNGYTYIYDTNMGVNIIKTGKAFIPFGKWQFQEKMVNDIETTLDRIKYHCKQIEREHGPVRLMFTPLYFGDKLDVVFKDYNSNNQPILKNNVNIDNESKIKNEISTEIFDAQQFQEEE